MKGRIPSRLTFLAPAIVCLAVCLAMGLQLSRQMREDLLWTPLAEAPTLTESRSRAEVLVGDELLHELAEDGRLRVDGRVVEADGLRVRFNNADTIARAQMIILAASGAAGIVLLVAAMMLPARERRPLPDPAGESVS